jgi:hypothetical protein
MRSNWLGIKLVSRANENLNINKVTNIVNQAVERKGNSAMI